MKLYHRSEHAAAILVSGFSEKTGAYMTASSFYAVWFSERPMVGRGELLTVEIPDDVLRKFEWAGGHPTNREFLIPASLANKYGPPVLVKEIQ